MTEQPSRLLLVDDNPDDRRLVRRSLEREFPGIEITDVSESIGLESALEAGGFDVVVTDYGLRWSDGLAVLRTIRARHPDRPVIMFTGTGNQEIAVEAMKAGLTDYVVKTPRQYGQLPYVVRAALEQVRQRKAIARLEEQLQQTHKMEALGQLAGGIAHDFNNLLTVISGHAQLLEQDLDVDDPRRDDATAIREAADRASAITRQLLAFSRRQPLRPERLDLGAAIDQALSLVRRLIGSEVELVVERPAEEIGVVIDRSQLEQVVMNLAVNARDAMPGGGRLTVAASTDGDEAVLVVSDTGTGMSDAVLARLFEPFFTTKEPGRGTGLGLATVYGAIDGAGGSVTVRSEPGAGAVFEIRLPLADRAQPPPDEERASPRPAAGSGEVAGARPVVLIVDDEPAIRQLATRLLERAEFDVLVADGGAEAVRLVLDPSVRIDLVLTDLVMPGVTGTEVAMAARAHRPHAGVLFMSGFVAADVLTSLDAPVVPKPFTADDLIDAVSTSLGRGNAATRPDPE